jgi:hypothetical protein
VTVTVIARRMTIPTTLAPHCVWCSAVSNFPFTRKLPLRIIHLFTGDCFVAKSAPCNPAEIGRGNDKVIKNPNPGWTALSITGFEEENATLIICTDLRRA